jgi:UDP-2,4-diacetamido-2,4,6-trideoxy-beta-L-altropyranose hydrolase
MAVDRGQDVKLILRPARMEDCGTVFQWRNDPFVMRRGSSQEPVSLDEHSRWFAMSLASPRERILFVAECDGVPAGLARFDRDGADDAIISVYLIERFTGQGLGGTVIQSACREATQRWNVRRVLAFVRNDNPAGMKAFLGAGFTEISGGNCPQDHRAFSLACE